MNVPEIREELLSYDFHPRIQKAADTSPAYLTPDGLILLRTQQIFLLELKTSWNEADILQACKYAQSPGWVNSEGEIVPFGVKPCVLLGYQKLVRQENLDKLFREFKAQTGATLVVFRYALETGTENPMSFSRLAHSENGQCPPSEVGKLFNYAHFQVRAGEFKFQRSKFDKANDEVIDSYAAVIW